MRNKITDLCDTIKDINKDIIFENISRFEDSDILNNIKNGTKTAVDLALPYVSEAGHKISSVYKTAENVASKKIKEKSKSVRRYRFIKKLKSVLDLLTAVTLLAATIIAFVNAIKMYLNNKEN